MPSLDTAPSADWSAAAVRLDYDVVRCRAAPLPSHYRSIVAACSGIGAAFASGPTGGRPESGRCRKSGGILSPPCASGSRLVPQCLQPIPMLIEQLRAATHPGLPELVLHFRSA